MAHTLRCAGAATLAGTGLLLVLGGLETRAGAAEVALLSKENWASHAPKGKEADAIYGDFVMRNDRLTAVIGFPGERRHANFATLGVGGAVIDLEARDAPSDQLTAFYPGGGSWVFQLGGAAVGKAVPRGVVGTLEAVRAHGLAGSSVSL